jgi:hypothetical protein
VAVALDAPESFTTTPAALVEGAIAPDTVRLFSEPKFFREGAPVDDKTLQPVVARVRQITANVALAAGDFRFMPHAPCEQTVVRCVVIAGYASMQREGGLISIPKDIAPRGKSYIGRQLPGSHIRDRLLGAASGGIESGVTCTPAATGMTQRYLRENRKRQQAGHSEGRRASSRSLAFSPARRGISRVPSLNSVRDPSLRPEKRLRSG